MEPEKKSNGALVGSIIIILILVIGGIYIWQSKVKNVLEEKKFQEENVIPEDTSELNTLEEEIGTTDVNLDVDINTLE
mgnify:CR=1 FL=1